MIRGMLYIVVFAAGALAAGLFPSFSTQYHQRLQAQLDQVNIDLAPFQTIADRYHGGSMDALIQHHLNSTDPTFHAEGEAIQLMVDSQAMLAESQSAIQTGYYEQAVWLYDNRKESVVQATWNTYQPALMTDSRAITFSLGAGLAAVILFWIVLTTLTYGVKRLFATKRMPKQEALH